MALAVSAVGFLSVSAGKSNRDVATNASFAGSIDTGTWYVAGGVTGADNAIVFNSETNDSIISKQYAAELADYGVNDVLNADVTMTIAALPEGAVFSVRFGLEMFMLDAGVANSGEIAFTGTAGGGISVSVNSYDANGQKTTLHTGTSDYVAAGTAFVLSADAATGGKFSISFGNGTDTAAFWSNAQAENQPFDCVGYFGFSKAASAENVNVVISSAVATAYAYDNPSNPVEVLETFDNNAFNKEAWFTISHGTGEYEGSELTVQNGELLFNNTNEALISTRHEYSNFELTFDITDMHREAEIDADGNVINPVSGWIGIAFGSAAHDSSFDDSVRRSTFFQFEPYQTNNTDAVTGGRYLLWENYVAQGATNIQFVDGYNFWNENDVNDANGNPRTINLKFTMIDGVFSCWAKYEDEADFSETPHYTYDLGYTPLGYVRVLTYGGFTGGYMAIDNLKIVNKDFNAEDYKVEIGYTSNIVEYDPFEYTDTWNDNDLLADGAWNTEGGCSGSAATSAAWAAAALLAASAAALVVIRKREKGGNRK